MYPYGWNIPVRHQPSRKKPAASGRDLISQSAARIIAVIQIVLLQQFSSKAGSMVVRGCFGIAGNDHHGTATTRRHVKPSCAQVVSPTLSIHGEPGLKHS